MGSGLQRATNAARASRGLRPRPVHKRSNRGDFAQCGVGFASPTVFITDDPEAVSCGNCRRVQRTIERDRRARELARQSLYKAD